MVKSLSRCVFSPKQKNTPEKTQTFMFLHTLNIIGVRPGELSLSQVFYEGFSLTADFLPWRLKGTLNREQSAA